MIRLLLKLFLLKKGEMIIDRWTILGAAVIAGPTLTKTRCWDCGGMVECCSPPVVNHTSDCVGIERMERVQRFITAHAEGREA